jgi:hypothetical protein
MIHERPTEAEIDAWYEREAKVEKNGRRQALWFEIGCCDYRDRGKLCAIISAARALCEMQHSKCDELLKLAAGMSSGNFDVKKTKPKHRKTNREAC